ncbi:MAG: outer membrane beta-barrel protein [Candidatus Andeanibacterium colombiense]|uniref:Outer membrane beta-barrel protein n=1 Tax=Candidatus Andeanibacterium colombiense TaxID=3121345 RepID=A0AAJ6BNI1_9SPHN|nr:MAG: outer membrane beta-barrel protein [Sphingomonadaceae bacterium]
MKYLFAAAVLACGLAQPAFAEQGGNDKAGFRAEARVTLETPTVSNIVEDDDVYKLGTKLAFGGEAGFDIAASDKVVVGPYGTFEVSTVKSCEGGDCISATNNYAVGLHVGLKVGKRGLAYVKAGYASLGIKVASGGLSVTERGNGVEGAVGYEQGFGKSFYGRLEFGYGDNGKIYGIDFQRRHASIALGARI